MPTWDGTPTNWEDAAGTWDDSSSTKTGSATFSASGGAAAAGLRVLRSGSALAGAAAAQATPVRVLRGGATFAASGGALAYIQSWRSGVWVSNPIPLGAVLKATASAISWSQTVPPGSSVTVETSIDAGTTWAACANGGDITSIVPGASLVGLSLLVRVTLVGWGGARGLSVSDIAIAIQSVGEKWRVLSVAPQTRGPVTVVLAEPFQLSQATSQIESTGGVTFNRVDDRTDPSRPNPGAVPPPPPAVHLSVLEDTIAGSTRYKIAVSWSFAPSSFITGYAVQCTANGETRDVGTFAASNNSCTISAFAPDVLHTVTVTALTAAGKSASASASITPGSGTTCEFGIVLGTLTQLRSPVNSQDESINAGVYGLWEYVVTGNSVPIASVSIWLDGSTLLYSGTESSQSGWISSCGSWEAGAQYNPVGVAPGSVVTGVCKLADGRIFTDTKTFGAPSLTRDNLLEPNIGPSGDLVVVGASARTVVPATGSSPTPGAIPFKYIDGWGYGKADVGIATVPGGMVAGIAVSFSVTFASPPSVAIAAQSNVVMYVTGITMTGFTLWTNDPAGGTATWIAFGS